MQIEGFDWDEGNINKNLEKHNVSVKECEEVFFNKPQVIYLDQKHSAIEKRYVILGITNLGRQLQVVFTLRKKFIRVISARAQSVKERRLYEKETKTN